MLILKRLLLMIIPQLTLLAEVVVEDLLAQQYLLCSLRSYLAQCYLICLRPQLVEQNNTVTFV